MGGFIELYLIRALCWFRVIQVEGIVKQLAAVGDHDKITAVINLLTTEFTSSPQANHRKVEKDYYYNYNYNYLVMYFIIFLKLVIIV